MENGILNIEIGRYVKKSDKNNKKRKILQGETKEIRIYFFKKRMRSELNKTFKISNYGWIFPWTGNLQSGQISKNKSVNQLDFLLID